jgi:formylglycine-generating enzyme required for sulfatase activity
MEIYLHQNGERSGPYTLQNLQAWLEAGQLTVADAAWFEGCSDWVTVQDVPGIMLPGGDHLVNVSTVPPFEAYQGDDPYVFISYSHKDAAVVYEEIARLHEAEVNVWYDEGIEASNEWPEEIARAVVDCTVFLVFVSPRATDSVNCRNEINLALNENKPFLAIHLEETELPLGLRLRMGDLQAILSYKLPVDRYQKKTQNSLEQLLGKKRGKKRKASVGTQEPEAAHEPELAEQVVQTTATSKPRRKGLAVALASLLLIACCTLGYLFLGDDGEDATETSTTTFTPGQPWTVPTASIEMLWCKPGTFMMGSPESEEGRELDSEGKKTKYSETQHQVTLTKGFYLGKYEVTQAQWKKVVGTSPSKFKGEDRPVEKVNWPDSIEFCQKLTLLERKAGRLPDGWEYALPTEAQWEYTCRAGTTSVFSFGDSLSSKQANFNGTNPYGGAAVGPNQQQTTDVGSYGANPWGFYDMHGNVWEWCADWMGNYPTGSLTDSKGPASGKYQVQRGGSWYDSGTFLRSAERLNYSRSNRYPSVGFRLCLRQNKVEQPKQPTPGQPWTVPTASIEMLWCKPGTFMMGSPESEEGRELNSKGKIMRHDEARHQVTLTKGFYLGKYEVTQTQWKKVMATSPSKFFGECRPVAQVSWTEALRFCQELTLLERKSGRVPDGWEYTLPTEAQWEYACRAGTTTIFSWGDTASSPQANFKGTEPYGKAEAGPFLERTIDVGSYPANPWGFHDMHGNVWEWCADWVVDYPTGSLTDPTGPASGSRRAQRGGSWLDLGANLRAAERGISTPGTHDSNLGFRLSLRQVGK